ncbi:MAG: hypothetical protein JSV91_14600 [Phycisphaerales bacterium]|nr:MAG: hypothetical protein JSV91_14600 [Phycisphaerales bacterium]
MTIRQALAGILVFAAVMLLVSLQAGAGDGAGAGPTAGNSIRGGRMWDKWWVVRGIDPPQGEHPLYPPDGQQSGSSTFRCKECHGWDYKGADGAYGEGSSHYTGIPGVFGSIMTPQEMFDLIKFADPPFGHGYGDYGLTNQDIYDLVDFLQTHIIDTDDFIDDAAAFIGDEAQGHYNYTEGGMMMSCVDCHGVNGTNKNFGTPEDPEWVGTVAVHNPWELLHKIRFGQPGAMMPSWLHHGGSNQGAADIGVYAQLNFPVGTCAEDVDPPIDGVVDIDDLFEILDHWGEGAGAYDLNDDGMVDIDDVFAVLAAWGNCS